MNLDYEKALKMGVSISSEHRGFRVYIPIILVLILMVASKLLPQAIPDLGMP